MTQPWHGCEAQKGRSEKKRTVRVVTRGKTAREECDEETIMGQNIQ